MDTVNFGDGEGLCAYSYSLASQTMQCSDFAYCLIVLSFTFIML